MTKQLLSSGEFYKLRYDTIPVKSISQTFLSIPIVQKCRILSCDTLATNERYLEISSLQFDVQMAVHRDIFL